MTFLTSLSELINYPPDLTSKMSIPIFLPKLKPLTTLQCDTNLVMTTDAKTKLTTHASVNHYFIWGQQLNQ